MHKSTPAALALALSASLAHAQFSISWYTIDGGGGTSSGGNFSLSGTLGQPDAGTLAGGAFACGGGFWPGAADLPSCYPNCDNSSVPPILNVNDFQCFLNLYAAGNPSANCDGSTAPPILNVNDFQCFLNKYAAGCP